MGKWRKWKRVGFVVLIKWMLYYFELYLIQRERPNMLSSVLHEDLRKRKNKERKCKQKKANSDQILLGFVC